MKHFLSIAARYAGVLLLIFVAHRLWLVGLAAADEDWPALVVALIILAALFAVDRLSLAVALTIAACAPSFAAERSREITQAFQREHPCPSTGKPFGACPGWVKDHINPLCNGGPDAVSNLQWQTVEDAKVKDRWERDICRAKHHS